MAQTKMRLADVRNPIVTSRAAQEKAKYDLMDDLLDAMKTTRYAASGAISETDGFAILDGALVMTLADGTVTGETILVACRGASAKITPANLTGGTELLLTQGEVVKLIWRGSAWAHVGHVGTEHEMTLVAHGLSTGDGDFYLASSGTMPAGSAALTKYWIIRLNADNFQLASSSANAAAGSAITLTSAGTGTVTLTRPVSVASVQNVAAVKASLDLGNLGQNVDTVIEATSAGTAGNSLSITFEDGSAVDAGVLSRIGNAFTFAFKTGVTTVLDFETAVIALAGADDLIAVKTTGTPGSVLVTADDEFVATNLAGGVNPVDEFTATAHGIPDEAKVRIEVQPGGVLPAGLAALTDYWAIVGGDPDKISLASSLINAQNNVAIDITTTGTLPLRILHLAYKTITSIDFTT